MLKRFLPGIVALIVFVLVGAFVLDNQFRVAFRNAEGARDACYLSKGVPIDPVYGGPAAGSNVPTAARDECTQPMRDYQSGTGPYIAAAAAALVAALIVLGIFALRRRARRRADAS